MTDSVIVKATAQQLKALVERIERLEEEKKTNPFIHAITLALPLLFYERQSAIECGSKTRWHPDTGEWEVIPDTLDPEDAPYVARFDEAIAACLSALAGKGTANG